jgi:prolyl 4-hydroxylase
MASNRLTQAGGFDVTKGQTTISDYRITEICFFQKMENPVIMAFQQKISQLTKTSIDCYEGPQYGKYKVGGYYKVHWDYCDPSWGAGSANFLNRGGQRWLTVIVYLNTLDEDAGGITAFNDNDPPLEFRPVQGKALVFYNTITDIDENGIPHPTDICDQSTKHSAEPVLKGEKHIITQWARERTFI